MEFLNNKIYTIVCTMPTRRKHKFSKYLLYFIFSINKMLISGDSQCNCDCDTFQTNSNNQWHVSKPTARIDPLSF